MTKFATELISYCSHWLNTYAYKNEQQGNVRLIKSVRLINRKGLGVEGRAIKHVHAFPVLQVSWSHNWIEVRHGEQDIMHEHFGSYTGRVSGSYL